MSGARAHLRMAPSGSTREVEMTSDTAAKVRARFREGPEMDAALRARTDRVDRLDAVIQERMTRRQKNWGENLTVLGEPSVVQLPLVLRHARAFEKVPVGMSISIEDNDLIVGITVEDGDIVRTFMPVYATREEHDQASKQGSIIAAQLGHKTPYYYDVLEKGLSGIIAEIDGKMADISARPQSIERDEKLALFQAMRVECNAVIAMANLA